MPKRRRVPKPPTPPTPAASPPAAPAGPWDNWVPTRFEDMTEAEIEEAGQFLDAHQTPEDQRPLGLGSSLLFSGEGVRRLMAADQRRREQAEAGEDGEDGEGDQAGPLEPDV